MTGDLFPDLPKTTLWHFENLLRAKGFSRIAGIDEAGRGPLAGPVVAAAVILPQGVMITGLNDSKKLSAATRDRLFDEISEKAVSIGVGQADAATVDSINILQATLAAMQQAVARLPVKPDYLLIDGISPLPLNISQKTIKKGDSLSFSIAAASIMAKVTRDRMMLHYDRQFPGYGFAAHKGYGCASHMSAIAALGPCPIHRTTFRGVKEHLHVGT